jgi:hypothetical protein
MSVEKTTPDSTVQASPVASASNPTNPQDTSLPPDFESQIDGGLESWLQVFACWLLFMNTWLVSLKLLYTPTRLDHG